MVLEYGNRGNKYSVDAPPVAVFNFDSTCIKNDIGDITTFWMLNNNLIYHPRGKDWSNVSPLLTQEVLNVLNVTCSNQGEPGSLIVTDQTDDASRACADEIVSIYYDGVTTSGDAAFIQGADEFINPSYAFTVQLQAGYTLDEIRAITRDAIDFALSHSLGDKQTIGNNFIEFSPD